MRRAAPFLLLSALSRLVAWRRIGARAQQETPSVAGREGGRLDRPDRSASYLLDAIEDAERAGSTLVLQLDSAGTLDQDAVALAERIHDATRPGDRVGRPGAGQGGRARASCSCTRRASARSRRGSASVRSSRSISRAPKPRDLRPPRCEDLATGWVPERGRETPLAFPERADPRAGGARREHRERRGRPRSPSCSRSSTGGRSERPTARSRSGPGSRPRRGRAAASKVRFVDLGPIDRVLHAAASPTWIYVLLVLGLAGARLRVHAAGVRLRGVRRRRHARARRLRAHGRARSPGSGSRCSLAGIGLLTLDVRLRRLGPLTGLGMRRVRRGLDPRCSAGSPTRSTSRRG